MPKNPLTLIQWLWLMLGAFLVYQFLPARVRVPYLVVISLGGFVFADMSGGLVRLRSTFSRLSA